MSGSSTFLPEEYVKRKREAMTNVICLSLFALVMFGTFVAFLVTNRRWSEVQEQQAEVNAQYAAAAVEISELMELQDQQAEMLERAELAASLVERVPRSILLAELINRMPKSLALLEFELESEKIKVIERPEVTRDRGSGGRVAPRKRTRPGTVADATAEGREKVRAAKYKVTVGLTGVAPTDREVARFLAELNMYPLIRSVDLRYSEETQIAGTILREFRIEMELDPDSDMREITPLNRPRDLGTDPMRRGGYFDQAEG